jgi:hypothetical protein
MHLKESRDQKLPLWAYTHVLGMLRERTGVLQGLAEAQLFLYLYMREVN